MCANKLKICMISSSGGHFEQLKMLGGLEKDYELFWVTEKTVYAMKANYYLKQTGLKDKWFLLKMLYNAFYSLLIMLRERPFAIITTGTMVVLPMCLYAKMIRKKIIYIETFARVRDGTKAGKLMYKFADLFIYQWESLKDIYPNGVYGGSIY